MSMDSGFSRKERVAGRLKLEIAATETIGG